MGTQNALNLIPPPSVSDYTDRGQTAMTAPTYLTAAQAAEILHVTPWRITEACRSGRLTAYKPGKTWLIKADDLTAYVETARTDDAA